MEKGWEEHFLDLLSGIGSKSKDPSTKVGCIITGPDHGFRVAGFNGFARGVRDQPSEVPERYERPEKYLWTAHAEANAVYYAANVGIPLGGCFIYVDWLPCAQCADAIIQAGIKKVVYDADSSSSNNEELRKRWEENHRIANIKFSESGVTVVAFSRNKIDETNLSDGDRPAAIEQARHSQDTL